MKIPYRESTGFDGGSFTRGSLRGGKEINLTRLMAYTGFERPRFYSLYNEIKRRIT
jgi:hypothetical protein